MSVHTPRYSVMDAKCHCTCGWTVQANDKRHGLQLIAQHVGTERETRHLSVSNMSAHTPGPWNVEHPFGEPGVYVVAKSTALIAKVYPADGEWVVDQRTSTKANARLIAAAPRMLAELKMLRNEYDAEAIDEHSMERIAAILRDVEGESNG